MNYIGIDCAYCGKKFEQTDDIVVCPICGTPHHRSCWNENGRCVNEEKHIEGFIWQTSYPDRQPAQVVDKNKKICPVCGQENQPFEPDCIRCGERLKNPHIPQLIRTEPQNRNWNQAPEYKYNPYHNVYAQDARTVYGENTEIDSIPVTEAAEYIQKDSTKYIGKFIAMNEKKTKFSWNWSAALAGVYWCFYRKMIGLGIAIVAIIFSVNLVAGTATVAAYEKMKPEVYSEYTEIVADIDNALTNADSTSFYTDNYELYIKYVMSPITVTANIISVATSLIVSIILGFFGNYFYKKKMIKDINTIRQVATDNMVYHIYLKQKGNVSVVNLLMPMLINSMLNMLISIIPF